MKSSDSEAVLVLGVMHSRGRSAGPVLSQWEDQYGERLYSGEPYDFDYTSYYRDEMGTDLIRRWYVFRELFPREDLQVRKQTALELEQQFAGAGGARRYNLDPGYVTGAKLVLASRKNHAHRIYLGGDVYAEVSLRFERGTWKPWPWTYPDLRESIQEPWLNRAREHWLERGA